MWGKSSVHPLFFYGGKFSMYICWGLGLIKAINPGFGWFEVPVEMSWAGSIIFAFASVIMLLSFYDLGKSLKYGLPDGATKLVTNGLYRFSRHPLYLGMFLGCFGSIIFFPDPVNVFFAAFCIIPHLFIITVEEKFLAERFGKDWNEYVKKTRRFL